MAKQPHTPESLAAYLDEILIGNSPIGDEDPLVETALKLRNAPKPVLSDAALARIESRLLEVQSATILQTNPLQGRLWFIGVSLLVGIVILVVWILVALSDNGDEPFEETVPIIETTEQPAEATVEPESTLEASESSLPEDVDVAEILNLPPMIVLEGTIEDITGSSLTVFGVTFDMSYNPDMLSVYEVGDDVRIQGAVIEDEDETIFVALQVIPVEDAEIPLRALPLSIGGAATEEPIQVQADPANPVANVNTSGQDAQQVRSASNNQQSTTDDNTSRAGQNNQNNNRNEGDQKKNRDDEGSQ